MDRDDSEMKRWSRQAFKDKTGLPLLYIGRQLEEETERFRK